MASIQKLLEAAAARSIELEKADQQKQGELKELNAEIAKKRAEKSIKAQEAISAMLKQKEVFTQETKTLSGAVSIVRKAIAKLQKAADLGLDDWSQVHMGTIKLSGFAKKKLETEPTALADLKDKSGGSSLTLKDNSLEFAGSKDNLKKVKAAIDELESNYETWIECGDPVTLNLFTTSRGSSRPEMAFFAERHKINIQLDSNWFGISGPQETADKVAGILMDYFAGADDIEFPGNLLKAVRAKAREVQDATGALIDVPAPRPGQGGWLSIRGLTDLVQQASEQLNAWLDEQEGAVRELQDFSDLASGWTQPVWTQFRDDIQHLAQNFRISVKETSNVGELELRGAPDAVSKAQSELQMMLDWYRSEQEKNEQAIKAAEDPPEEDDDSSSDGWSTAPVADCVVAAW